MPRPDEATSTELLARLKRREGSAQLALRQRALPRITATARHYLKDDLRAEEMAEDIWVDFVLKYVDNLQHGRAIDRYLHMMTVSRCIRFNQFLRTLDPVSPCTQDPSEPAGENIESEIIDAIDQPAVLSRLHACLESLAARKQRMVRLRFFQGETFSAIGQAMGISRVYAGRVVQESMSQLLRCMTEVA